MPPVRDPITVRAHTRKRPKPKPKPVHVESRSDAAQGYGLKRANNFKKTKQFKRDEAAARNVGIATSLKKLAANKIVDKPKHRGFSPVAAIEGAAKVGHAIAQGPEGIILDKVIGKPIRNLGIATYHHPVAVPAHTATGFGKMALNLPGGLLHAATQSPVKTGEEIVNDYIKRYGQSDKEMQRRFAKEGAAPEILDALGAEGAVGGTLGKLARGSKVMSEARPLLRTSGGVAREQGVSSNLFHAVGQRQLDKARARAMTKKMAKTTYDVDEARAPVHVVAAHEANAAAGRTVEVTPLRNASKAQRVDVAKLKSRAVQMLKSEQHRRIEKGARRVLHGLSKPERKAFYAVAEGWAPADARALEHLKTRRQSIVDAREAEGIGKVRRGVDELGRIDYLIKHHEEAFTPRVRDAVRALRKQDVEVGRADPGLTAAQRLLTRYGPQARHLGLSRGELGGDGLAFEHESVPAFIRRVQAEADKHGLERPLYFPHEGESLAHNADFASRAVGGARAVNAPKQRAYKLFDRGTRDTSPEVYLTGLARSIKRKHNWNLVADQYERHTLPGLRNLPLGALKKELHARGIDPKDVGFWNAGRYRVALKGGEEKAATKHGDNVSPAEELGAEQLQHALTEATHPSGSLNETKGWSVVPKAAHDEIMAAAKPSGKPGRIVDIANGKQSRFLLGLNPPWNMFQVLSNAGLGMLATNGRLPLRMAQAERLYSQLSPEARDRMDALIGEGAGTHGHQVHLGATAKGGVTKRYRNLKANPAFDKPLVAGHGPTARQLNPVEAGFAADRFQNKHFRRAVLVDSIKKQAKSLDPHTVESLLRNPAKAERAAADLDKWLGDYTSYTHAERMGIKKAALFYGYLRHSLNVMLHTLPAEHPLMTSILGKLGQLQSDELKKLGLDGLPWANGKWYYTQDGHLKSIDLARANPVANAVTGAHGVKDLLGLTQPVVQIIGDQIYHHDSFKDKSWATYGLPGAATANLKDGFFNEARPRVLANQVLGMSYPYRVLEKKTLFGPQGNDSLPWSPRPTKYKRSDYKRFARQQAAQDRKDASWTSLLFPFLPRDSHDVAIAKSMAKSNAASNPRKKSKKKQSKSYFGSGGGGGSSKPKYFGAGG